jgi:hypothetical protein
MLGRAVAIVVALAGFAQAALAQTIDWNAGTGSWFDAGNWDPARPPTSANRTTIDNGGTVLIQAPGAQSQALLLGSFRSASARCSSATAARFNPPAARSAVRAILARSR